ncbi:helix-turn-helix transcriptional regulator [Serratia fonticola]|nr:helix-turn-helix transcriptional regulator [Serratia fonticola]
MRKQAGLSQAELAKRLGVTPPAINRLEKNQLAPASKR